MSIPIYFKNLKASPFPRQGRGGPPEQIEGQELGVCLLKPPGKTTHGPHQCFLEGCREGRSGPLGDPAKPEGQGAASVSRS